MKSEALPKMKWFCSPPLVCTFFHSAILANKETAAQLSEKIACFCNRDTLHLLSLFRQRNEIIDVIFISS